MKIDETNRKSPTPKIGTKWIRNMDNNLFRELISVVDVYWSDDRWWVLTQTLLSSSNECNLQRVLLHNFFDKCLPVLTPELWIGRVDQFCDVWSEKVT